MLCVNIYVRYFSLNTNVLDKFLMCRMTSKILSNFHIYNSLLGSEISCYHNKIIKVDVHM